MMLTDYYLFFLFRGIFLLFAGLGIIFIVYGIRTGLHAKGKCGAVLVEAECIEVIQSDYTSEFGYRSYIRTYQRKTKYGVYRYTYEGVQYTQTAFLATNLKRYAPKPGMCTIAINAKHPEKVYAPAGAAACKLFLFIGILFVLLPIIIIAILFIISNSIPFANIGSLRNQ